jgi:beta-N-acetylhexosaminidase
LSVSNDFSKGAENASAVIFAVEGLSLSEGEKALFRQADPLGFILFARNVETPEQVAKLCAELREAVGRECPIMIDQEGGRVARMKPPVWRGYAAARTFGAIAEADKMRGIDDVKMRTMMLAEDLRASGLNVNCDPVLDVLRPETHDVIGDRAYSDDPALVGEMGIAICEQYLKGGITPIIKHIPGHGRAEADSHLELPRVEASLEEMRALDFVPFKMVAESKVGAAAWAMSAHILYPAIDAEVPLTLSRSGIDDIIRGEIGFDGILVSDDVSMKALDAYGDIAERCVKSIEAGCDMALYCAGKLDEMEKIAESVPNLGEKALKRLQKAALS